MFVSLVFLRAQELTIKPFTGLIFVGALYPLSTLLGLYSARTQNKFLILMQLLFLVGLFVLQLMFGGIALTSTTSTHSHDQQVACLTLEYYEKNEKKAVCEHYFQVRLALVLSLFSSLLFKFQTHTTVSYK